MKIHGYIDDSHNLSRRGLVEIRLGHTLLEGENNG
jgi:hypothetical protein